MDIAAWLRSLGLEQYEPAFRANAIDAGVLQSLTGEDLKELGVGLIGHRRRLLAAIAALGGAESTGVRTAASRDVASLAPAERRQVTVMFCDLVGSTALSARLDPEDLSRLYRAYRDACVRVVARYEGHLAQFMGDGVMVYFGYPQAHEDDAERAVRAGLDVLGVVGWLRTPGGEQVESRIGIATGLVVAGDLSSQEQAVVGETPNLAARLQSLAAPGTVVVAASTRRLLGELFRLRALGRLAVKGIGEPVEAWAVEGETPSESRFEMVRARRLTSFVGREPEVALLEERRRLAWRGEGQVVLISGEAGIGKSRFAARFSEQVADQPHTRLRYQCSPYHTASAFYPIIEHLKRAAGFDPDDPPVTQLDKLEAMIAPATLQVKDMAPLFAALLSLPSGDRYPSLGLSAPQRRQQTLAALLDQLEGVATRQPVLLVFEDVHWADASTVEVLDLMIERVRALPVLALLTYRPEFEPSWVGRDTVTLLALGRLDRAEACAMIERVSTGKPLPDEVMAQILAKTDGVPLFVEELTKTVLESGLLVEDARGYRLDGLLSPLAIPATLQDSLMARLDRLAPVREIAQIGAAIGREFSYALLHAVAGRKDAALDAALARLEAAELLFQSAAPPDARYRFKHALVQDAAYETLLRSQRQILHRRIAETLREHFPAIVEGEPEMIAHHFTQAGLTEQAVEWWSKAGEQGAGRSAYIEAIAHYGQAIALADTLSIAPSRQQSRLGLQIAYGQALNAARGPGALETTAAFARARELAAQIENLKERFPVYNGLWISNVARGEVASARSVAEAFLRETETRPGSPEAGMAHRTMGMTACMEGNLVDAQVHLGRAVASYHSGWDQPLRSHYGQDLGIAAMNNLAVVLWQIGEVGRACEFAEEGLTRAVHTGHIPTMVYGYFYKCIFEAQRRNAERAMSSSEPLVDLSSKHFTQSNWLAMGTFVLGWARWLTGDREAGTAGMRQGIAFFREHGLFYNLTLLRGLFAETEAAAGNLETALATLDDAFCDAERTGLRWFRSELYRQRGEILLLLRPGDLPAAEQAFDSALTIARRQQARSFELRAALSLARLRRDQGRCTEAGDLLAPVYGWFTEGFDTPDLREAKALLDGLA